MFTELGSVLAWSLLAGLLSDWKQIGYLKSGNYTDEYSPESFVLQLIGQLTRILWLYQIRYSVFESWTMSAVISCILCFVGLFSSFYKSKLMTLKQKDRHLHNPITLSRVSFLSVLISLCVGSFEGRLLLNKVVLATLLLESSNYLPQLYHSRNYCTDGVNKQSLKYTKYQLVCLLLRIIFWTVLCLRSSTSLCLYHLLFDLLNLYLLKDFIVAYFFREKNGKIYFKQTIINRNRNGSESESDRSDMNNSVSEEVQGNHEQQQQDKCCGDKHGRNDQEEEDNQNQKKDN